MLWTKHVTFTFGNQAILYSIPHLYVITITVEKGGRVLGQSSLEYGFEDWAGKKNKKSPEYLVVAESKKVFLKKRIGHVRRTQELIQKILQWPTWDNLNNKINNGSVRLLPK